MSAFSGFLYYSGYYRGYVAIAPNDGPNVSFANDYKSGYLTNHLGRYAIYTRP